MFTGLIESLGQVRRQTSGAGGTRLQIASPLAGALALGDSVAVNGVCLTVASVEADTFLADVGPETLRVTALGRLQAGALVNLERPLKPDGRLGGHFVQGHVDGVGEVLARRGDADFEWLAVRFPPELAAFLVLKGSVAVDGISLTVARLERESFEVQVVPYTIAHTNISQMRPGDRANLECDLVGKYVLRAVELYGMGPAAGVEGPRRGRP